MFIYRVHGFVALKYSLD